MHDNWIAERMSHIEASGIRKVFDLAAQLKDPVNLSIGQPHFPVPDAIKQAAHAAIDADRNGYTVTQGIPDLRGKLEAQARAEYPSHTDRSLFVTSGTSGGLVLALETVVNPGDEVIVFDPYFVMYPHLITLAGGKTVTIDTYPDFQIDVDKVKSAITARTKAIIVNSPANPTGVVLRREVVRDLAKLAQDRGILLISDEIYRAFCFEGPFTSPAEFNDETLVLDGFSKTYGMTGWRLGFAHGPKKLIEEMTKLQQFTYVCAPSIVQHAGLAALNVDMSPYIADYKQKQARLKKGLQERFEVQGGEGAFYLFPKAPWGTGTEFVTEAIKNSLLVIPGGTFSKRDTHFRLSYAASDATIDRGLEILNRLARRT